MVQNVQAGTILWKWHDTTQIQNMQESQLGPWNVCILSCIFKSDECITLMWVLPKGEPKTKTDTNDLFGRWSQEAHSTRQSGEVRQRGERSLKKKNSILMTGLPLQATGAPPTEDLLGETLQCCPSGSEDAAGYLSTISCPSLVEMLLGHQLPELPCMG